MKNDYYDRMAAYFKDISIINKIPNPGEMSPLIIGKSNGNIVDCILTYKEVGYVGHDGPLYGPINIIKRPSVDVIGLNKTEVVDCEIHDFTYYFLGSYRDLNKYERLYPKVADFAFQEELSAGQKYTLKLFMEAWQKIASNDLKKDVGIYLPEFFEWADSKLA